MGNGGFALKDDDLKEVNGGVNWLKFSQLVLEYVDPAKYPDLFAAIAKQDWPRIAICTLSLMEQGQADILYCYKMAN